MDSKYTVGQRIASHELKRRGVVVATYDDDSGEVRIALDGDSFGRDVQDNTLQDEADWYIDRQEAAHYRSLGI
jgi:hypothetical protein